MTLDTRALINCLGFPNQGAGAVAARLHRRRYHGILGVNIGKNAVTPNERAVDDYLACFQALHAVADYIAINLSSPNTEQLRELQQPAPLTAILEVLMEARTRVQKSRGRPLALFLKISPDLETSELADIVKVIAALGLDGVIAANTTIRRPRIPEGLGDFDSGGLSGAPLLPLALDTVRRLRAALPAAVIIGCGGIQSADDAVQMRNAGADLVQLYTGLVYRGPRLIEEISNSL